MHHPRQIDNPTDWPFQTTVTPVISRLKSGRLRRRLGVYLPLSAFLLLLYSDIFVIGVDQYFGGPAGAAQLTWQAVWVMFVQPAVTLAVFGTGVGLYLYGTRLMTVSAWRFLTDRRPPVVLLRSFAYDSAEDLTHIGPFFYRRRFEESLVNVLQTLGPAITIGRPHEKLPKTGADRVYVSDGDWQAAVRYFTERAVAVVVIAGDSAGLHWETEQVLRKLPLDRLLFCFPYLNRPPMVDVSWFATVRRFMMRGWERFDDLEAERQHRYRSFIHFVASLLEFELPFPLGDAQYLIFDASGRARLLESQKSKLQQLVLWMTIPYRLLLPSSLQPIGSRVAIDHAATLKPFELAVTLSSETS